MTMKNFPDIASYAKHPFPFGYPVEEHVTLTYPDGLMGALGFFIDSAQHSIAMALPNLNDDSVLTAVLRQLQDPKVFTELILPMSAVAYDNRLRALVDTPWNYVDFLNTAPRGVLVVVDGMDSVTGDGASLTFTRHPMVAVHVRRQIDLLMARGK